MVSFSVILANRLSFVCLPNISLLSLKTMLDGFDLFDKNSISFTAKTAPFLTCTSPLPICNKGVCTLALCWICKVPLPCWPTTIFLVASTWELSTFSMPVPTLPTTISVAVSSALSCSSTVPLPYLSGYSSFLPNVLLTTSEIQPPICKSLAVFTDEFLPVMNSSPLPVAPTAMTFFTWTLEPPLTNNSPPCVSSFLVEVAFAAIETPSLTLIIVPCSADNLPFPSTPTPKNSTFILPFFK